MAKFQALEVALQLIPALQPLFARIASRDRDLMDQIRRAGASVPLNISEGARRTGRDRQHFYKIAAGSAAEVRAALAVAQGWGYIGANEVKPVDQLLDRVLAMLWRLTYPRE